MITLKIWTQKLPKNNGLVFVTTRFFVLDASALMSGSLDATEGVKIATTPGIIEEVHDPAIRVRIAGLKDAGILQPMEAGPAAIKQVQQAATQSGDLPVLSSNDIALLGLALDLTQNWEDAEVTLISGDFAIQNTAEYLKIKVEAVGTRIKKVIKWQWYCPACRKQNFPDPNIRECDVCGTTLKRRDAQRQQDRQRSSKRKW